MDGGLDVADQTQPDGVLMRRLGDIIQAIAVLAIVGMAVAVTDLRLRVGELDSRLRARETIATQQLTSLKEAFDSQINVLQIIVDKVMLGGFGAVEGKELGWRVKRLEELSKENQAAITTLRKDLGDTQIGKMKR